VQSAEIALSDALQKSNNTARDQALQRRQNNNSVADARQRLDELQSKSLKDAGVDTSGLDQQLASQRELNELKQAELALAEAKKKRADDANNAEKEAAKAAIAAEQAQLALNQARRKEQDDQKNDINNVTDAVKRLAEGDKSALDGINASAENISKGIIKAAADGGKSLGELKGDLSDLSSGAPGVKATFLEIGKVLQNIEDPALKSAVAVRLLGRAVGQDFLNVLSDPEKIESFIKRVHELGLEVDSVDKKVSEDFRSALFTLQNDIQLVATKLATAFGPGFTTILKAIDDALISNKNSLIQFADTVAARAVPVVESFIRVLSGASTVDDQWLVNYTDKLKAFGEGLGQLVGLVSTVFGAIVSGAGKVAEALNSVFGSNLNAFDVLFAAWVSRIVLGFAAVQAGAVSAATGVAVGLAPVLATLGLFAAAVYTVVKAWEALQDILGLGKTSHFDAILDGTLERLKAIGDILSGDITKGVEEWKAANEKQAAAEKSLDDVDKQVADGQKRRQQELLQAEKDKLKDSLDEHKKTSNEKDTINKQSADNQLASNKRVVEDTKKSAQETKASDSDRKLQERTVQDHPGLSFAQGSLVKGGTSGERIDLQKPGETKDAVKQGVVEGIAASGLGNNGNKLLDKSNVVNIPEGASQGQINDAFRRQQDATGAELKQSPISLEDAIQRVIRSGGKNDLTQPQPIMDPKEIQGILDEFKQFGTDIRKDPRIDAILELLSDRSDGSIKGQRPETLGQLERMLTNQQQIQEFENKQQDEFSKNIAREFGQELQKMKPGQVSSSYPPAVPGRYDQNGNFVPSDPKNVGYGTQPKTNPPGYVPGAPAPITFPDYQKFLKDSVFPQSVPLPTSRPAEAGPGSTNYQQQQKTMTDAVRDGVLEASKEVETKPVASRPETTSIPSGEPFPRLPLPESPPLSPDLQPPGINPEAQSIADTVNGFIDAIGRARDGVAQFADKLPQQGAESLTPQDQSTVNDNVLNTLRDLITQPDRFTSPEQSAPAESQQAPPTAIDNFFSSMLDSFNSLFTKLPQPETGPVESLGIRGDNGIDDTIQQADGSFRDAGSSADSLSSSLSALAGAAEGAVSGLNNVSTSSVGSVVQAATGGWIRGPGGPTGDKIPALLSDEEFVHSARATRFWGVDFMHAINNLQVPRFSTGGLVGLLSPSLPRFAAGGLVSAPSSSGEMPKLGSVDLRTDSGSVRVAVDRGGLTQLRRAAVMRNMGKDKQPGWVR
jgi:hypothetical protein